MTNMERKTVRTKAQYMRERAERMERETSFQIKFEQVVSTIQITDSETGLTAHEAAFAAVGRFDTAGTYRWQQPGGPPVKVTVEYEDASNGEPS